MVNQFSDVGPWGKANFDASLIFVLYVAIFKKKMESGIVHGTQHHRCERGHKQASKSFQKAHSFCLDLLATIMISH